jgi:hypothetical protein
MFPRWRGTYIWIEDPEPVAACDLALEGGNASSYTLGKWGKASGMRLPPDLENPKGRTVMFRDSSGRSRPRYGLQADQQFAIPRGESVSTARRLIEVNKKAGVRPRFFSCDRTGHGAGIADIMKHEWGAEIHDVNYSEGPSLTPIMLEDSKTCAQEFDRINSELWFAVRAYGEHGYFLVNPELDASELSQQLTNRLVRTSGVKSRVESKKDYVARGFKSPDEADSVTLLVHAARRGSGIVLSRLGDLTGDNDEGGDAWFYEGPAVNQRIDASNQTETLQ